MAIQCTLGCSAIFTIKKLKNVEQGTCFKFCISNTISFAESINGAKYLTENRARLKIPFNIYERIKHR